MINELPMEMIEYILSFLSLKERAKKRTICILWHDIILKWKPEIQKAMRQNFIKYVRVGDISFFKRIPLVAQYYLLDWAIQFKQKNIILYAIDNGYNHYYLRDNVCNIITYIKESSLLAHYFIPTKKSKIDLLLQIMEQGNLEQIQFLLDSLDNICLKIPKHNCSCHDVLQKLFNCQKNVIDYVLDYIQRFYCYCPELIPQIIYHSAYHGLIEILENYLPFNDEYYERMINGILDGFNDKVYYWYTKNYGQINFLSHHRINIKEIRCQKYSFIVKIIEELRLSSREVSLLYANLVYHNGQNNGLIKMITDYVIKNYCIKKSFSQFIRDRNGITFSIKTMHLDGIKYLLKNGYVIHEYDIKGLITHHRIDVLSYLKNINYHDLELMIDNIISYEYFMQKIPNYDTFHWIHKNMSISKTNNISHFVCYFINNENEIEYLNFIHHEGYPLDPNLYEDVIERCVNRKIKDSLAVLIFDFLYGHQIVFHYERIRSIIRYNHLYLSAIILKWFIKHGIEMSAYMTQTDDIIKIKWLNRHGCSSEIIP